MFNYYQDDQWSRILWHNYYNADHIDNVYLGSSHIYCDINPFLMDELTGEDNFNMSTGSQEIISSYYLLKEVLRKHELKHVFLELYYVPSTGISGDYTSKEATTNMWRNTDWMRFSLNKIQAIWDENGKEYLIDAVLPFTRYRNYLFDYNYIIQRHGEKKSENFLSYNYEMENEKGIIIYQDKGYYYSDWEIINPLYAAQRNSDEVFLTNDAEEYLRKTIELCQKENIEITLVVSPIYELQMLSIDTYDVYRSQIVEIADEYDVDFYDFNLIKDEYLSLQKPDLFYDVGHLNYKGAELYTRFLYNLVYENKYTGDEIFYNSYEDKIKEIPPQTWGIYTEDYTGIKKYHIASSPRQGLLYRIVVTPDEGEQYMIQDFDENNIFEITQDGTGTITIVTQFIDESISTLEIRY